MGLGIGVSAVVVPAYLGEVAPASARGTIVELYEVLLYALNEVPSSAWDCSKFQGCVAAVSAFHARPVAGGGTAQHVGSAHTHPAGEALPAMMFQVLLCAGMLAAALVDWALSSLPGAWRWMLAVPLIPALLMSGQWLTAIFHPAPIAHKALALRMPC